MRASLRFLILFSCALLIASSLTSIKSFDGHARPSLASAVSATPIQEGDKLVFADFETVQDNHPVSNRGGFIQITSYSESPSLKSKYKGPELVRTKKDDPNHALTFDYELLAPNQYAGVGVEIHGQADKNGKPVPDDVSGYKSLTLQLYVTGVTSMRLECTSRGAGGKNPNAYPQMSFKVGQGFNTYKVDLKNLSQPSWADIRVDPKEVLKTLTSITLTAFCDQCKPPSGTVVVDNIIFQK
jgi:hypothetical protein